MLSCNKNNDYVTNGGRNMKKVALYDVPIGKMFVFNHRMYRRTNVHYSEGYNPLYIPCVPVGVIHDRSERNLYCFNRVEF